MPDPKQHLQFPPLQTHVRSFEVAMVAISLVCVVAILVILLFTDIGNTVRP